MSTLTPSDAVRKLCERFDDEYDDALVWRRDEIYRDVVERHPEWSAARQFAMAFTTFLEQKPVVVRSYDLLAGHGQHVNVSASVPIVLPERFDPRSLPKSQFDVKREIRLHKRHRGAELAADDGETLAYFSDAVDIGLHKRWGSGHVIGGFARVVREGYSALEERVAQRLKTAEGEGRDYLEALLTTVRAARAYLRRYAAAAEETAAATSDPVERAAVERIARGCANLADKPAATFFEAVQSVWLLHEMLTFENYSGSMSIGRLDQILNPYYQDDARAGRLTEEDAQHLVDALWLKFASLIQAFQNVTLGGCDENGEPAVNDVTLLCLRASRKIARDQPLVCLRWPEKGMPDECWREARNLIAQGGGFPALFNDAVVVAAKRALGVDLADARDYGLIGCVEPSVGGKEYANTEELRVNWAKVLELMLSGGEDATSGRRVALKTRRDLDAIASFDELFDWYCDELVNTIRLGMRACDLLDSTYPVFFPSPMLSLTMDDCVDRAEDAAARGTVYRFSTVNGCGMANAVDSLAALRRLVFEEKRVTLSRFAAILRDDFAGEEELAALAVNACPKYGNDDDGVDALMLRLVDLVYATVNGAPNLRDGRYQVGLYTVDDHAVMGRKTGATPDGRRAGTSLANAMGPVQGADRQGPTATLNSATKIDFSGAGNGMVLDMKFHPGFFEKPAHRNALRSLVEAYFERGGMEIQFNVVSRETLLAAQREPARHRNLVVRVSGFSAYFVTLDPVLQDEIIRRTEYHGF